jgi:hypothetical protein
MSATDPACWAVAVQTHVMAAELVLQQEHIMGMPSTRPGHTSCKSWCESLSTAFGEGRAPCDDQIKTGSEGYKREAKCFGYGCRMHASLCEIIGLWF